MKKLFNCIYSGRIYTALLLTLFVIGLLFPVKNVSAEVVSGKCGDHVTWKINTDSGLMTISGTGAMWGYYKTIKEDVNYSKYIDSVSSLTIKNGITKIGDDAFACFKIKKLSIPSSVTTIGKEAFAITELTSLSIPSSVKTIGSSAFAYCYSLKKLTLANGVKTIGDNAFFATQLSSVTIPKSVTSIGDGAFFCDTAEYTGGQIVNHLKKIYIKSRKVSIDPYAFCGGNSGTPVNANLIIYGYKGSTAEKFAKKYKTGFRTFGVKIPSTPKITTLSKNKTRAKTKLKFTKVSGAYQYEIQIANNKNFYGEVLQTFVKNNSLSLKGISSSYTKKTVYVRVRAYKKTGGKIVVSNWSKVKKTKMKK